jgi:hypothetical protein
MMLNIDVINNIKASIDSLGHTYTQHKLLGEHADKDIMVTDVLLQPNGIVGAFFYTLNIVCMETHSELMFCPISIAINRDNLDGLEAKIVGEVEPNMVFGINILDESQIELLVFSTIDRLFQPVVNTSNKEIMGMEYLGCMVHTGGSGVIRSLTTEVVLTHALTRIMGSPCSEFTPVSDLLQKA